MAQTQIPAGYKQTEIGVIPEDWRVINFGGLYEANISRKSLKTKQAVTFVGMQDVSDGAKLTSQHQVFYDRVKSGYTYFEKGDVLVAKITPCFENGKGCHTESLKTSVGFGSTEFHVLRAKASVDSKFIYYWSTRNIFREQLESEMVGSAGHRRVPFSALQNYLIPYSPFRQEQTAIANALSDVDGLIAELDKLIAKKQAIKTATMQQLLTGKTRLPLFAHHPDGTPKTTQQTELGPIPEDWEVVNSSDLVNFIGGFGFSSRLATSSGVRWLKIANVGLNEIKWDADSYLPESLIDSFSEFSLKENDVVMALTRPLLGDRLKIARLCHADLPALLNQRVAKLAPKGRNNLDYIYYVTQRADFIAAMNLAMAGTDPPNIGTTALGSIKILTPPSNEEQVAIAQILSDMDCEIQTLQTRRTKTQQIKQGMMQQLLTGKIRLINKVQGDFLNVR